MTTTSTAASPSLGVNTDTSSSSSPNSSGDEKSSWGKLTSLLSPPRRVQSEPISSFETSPHNCLDITPRHPNTTDANEYSDCDWSDDSDDYAGDWMNSETPQRRGSPWSIPQALFPDDETENHAPVLGQKSPTGAPMRPTDEGQPNSYHYSSPQDYPAPPQPIRTRRSRGSSSRSTIDQGFSGHEHRRRKSAGSGRKTRASPQPLPSSSASLRGGHRPSSARHLSSHQHHHHHPPHSHSKSKKYKQQKRGHPLDNLDLPGLLEDRSNLSSSVHGADILTRGTSNLSVSSVAQPAPRSLMCRLRVTTFVWGLLIIGLTTLGRTALLTSHWEAVQYHTHDREPALPTTKLPTAGLRGSLLLATVGRKDDSKGKLKVKKPKDSRKKDVVKPEKKLKEDKPVAKKKESKEKEKKKESKEKKKEKPKVAVSSAAKAAVKKDKTKAKPSAKRPSFRTVPVAKPQPLDPVDAIDLKKYEYDSSIFKPSSTMGTPQRVVMLHDDVVAKQASPRPVELYPAEFTDNTQFYGEFESSDERLRKMEMRAPYSEGECVPMQDWQTTFHPFCNGVHELGVEYLGETSTETNVQLFGTKGYWRYAWRLDLRKQDRKRYGDTVVLKTLKFRHDFEDAHFEHDRIDAVAMERLTASPHVINMFGFCGHSVLTEYANGPRLGELADKSKSKPLARLRIARDIADGLADVHGIDSKDGNNATFVHLDINPANVVSIGGSLKLNDFNIGIIRRWNTTSQEPCGFPAQYPNPQWRSPEESRNENNLTEKVDVFSLGHIFFRLICGHEPWNKLEPDGKPSKETINEKVQQGQLPFIPKTIMKSTDAEVAAIRDAMLDCYRPDPTERPSAREISRKLEAVLEKLAGKRDSRHKK